MIKKIDILKNMMKNENWNEAILFAAKFPRLGEHKKTILSAREAILRPAFQLQIKKDPQKLISDGIKTLKIMYKL